VFFDTGCNGAKIFIYGGVAMWHGSFEGRGERAVLHIIYGEIENCIENTSVYFKNVYEPDWITSDIAREIIKDIDNFRWQVNI